MSFPQILEQRLRRAGAEVRLRRAERGAWRGAFWGALAAALLLALKGSFTAESLAVVVAAALVAVLAVLGAGIAAARRIDRLHAARLADRAYGLKDRLSTAVEFSDDKPAGPMYDALVAQTASELEATGQRSVLKRSYPWEARFVAVPALAGVALALAPALPSPQGMIKDLRLELAGAKSTTASDDRARAFGAELRQRDQQALQEASRRAAAGEQSSAADPSAYKDRPLKPQSQDFESFVKKGDDRLRLLEHSDRLPDLQSDFASSQYRLMMRKAHELGAGKGPQQVSQSRLGQILREMERLGRKGGDFSEDAAEGLEALDEGNTEQAMDSLQTALGKLRETEELQRNSRLLKGGRDPKADDSEDGRGEQDPNGRNDGDKRGYSLAKSKGNPSSGKATPRLRSTPYDAGVEGTRRGRAPTYETQMTSRPSGNSAQLQYLAEFTQYRRLMEDAIAREQVPRDYHDQIRDYFKSLNDQ